MNELWDQLRQLGHRIGRAILLTFAVIYFLIDLLFLSVLRPLRRRLMALQALQRLRVWVAGLNRYVALALFLVPWMLLEPIKPVGFYLATRGHLWLAILVIALGEIVKLGLLEQILDMTKPQLMTFRWFAWGYHHWHATMAYLRSLPIRQDIVQAYRRIKAWAVRLMR